ncbi:NAD-dependent epimerase/dehydratase family protein [Sabulilitoribacter multivorans]|uniref:NAD-dependent epimerase/dehydratase family protein n=1 Tax=Flaviramulus multivorans TaxID=1304750 RepID=A0ABS9IGK6_9FLAO|nr:NAD-dependent epimerase/dehydratase family protein [Flaviramulus multivorans]MCF7559891.1 NAD-dependent epimerase/dehydratase family protein [Flaviramulus multivorans]
MILVTGGTGLVGAHLLYKLVTSDKKVRAIYRNKRKLDNVKSVFSCYTDDYETLYNLIDWVEGDILDIPSLSEAFKGITKVYHCAAFVSFEPDKYQLLRKTNIEGTANIVNLSISNNIEKLCYVSSIATLGKELNNKPIDEDTNWNAEADNNVYAITKYGAEMEVWRGTQEGLKVVMVNPGVILGAGIWRYGTGSLFKKAKKGFKYYTSGTVALVDVEDVVSIMTKLMDSEVVNERFLLVAENWTYKDFLQALSKSVNTNPPKKLASSTLLKLGWKMDWLVHKLTGKRRQLTKHLAQSLSTETYYSSDKIKDVLNYKFKPVNKTIVSIGNQYPK